MANGQDLRQKRRGGFYWIDGKPYPTVTSILGVIDKGSNLMYWFGKEIYYALAKDPYLSEKQALTAPYATKTAAASRGQTVHSIIEAWKNTQTRIETVPQQFSGYAEAFYKWVEMNRPEVIESEKTIVSKKYGYAGTLDMVVKINNEICLVDFKTNRNGNIYDEVELQMSAYQQGLKEAGITTTKRIAVGLAENGTFNQQEKSQKLKPFLAALELWKWKNKDKCEKVGYLTESPEKGGDYAQN